MKMLFSLLFRREMMPLLSLIFSALFILFGTVVVQAFRFQEFNASSKDLLIKKTTFLREIFIK